MNGCFMLFTVPLKSFADKHIVAFPAVINEHHHIIDGSILVKTIECINKIHATTFTRLPMLGDMV